MRPTRRPVVVALLALVLACTACKAETLDRDGENDALDTGSDTATDIAADEATDASPHDSSPDTREIAVDTSGSDTVVDADLTDAGGDTRNPDLGLECDTDLRCGSRGLVCIDGYCEKVPCLASAECEPNQVCAAASCTPRECTADAECLADPRFGENHDCLDGLCQPFVVCERREDCSVYQMVCDPTLGRCVAPPPKCQGDGGCVYPLICAVASGTCLAFCVTDQDCPGDYQCFSGRCGPCACRSTDIADQSSADFCGTRPHDVELAEGCTVTYEGWVVYSDMVDWTETQHTCIACQWVRTSYDLDGDSCPGCTPNEQDNWHDDCGDASASVTECGE